MSRATAPAVGHSLSGHRCRVWPPSAPSARRRPARDVACSRTVQTVHLETESIMPSKTCGAEKARSNLPELLEEAHQGSSTVITKRGRPYAALVPLAQHTPSRKGLSLLKMKGSG